ncbi:MAG: serine hydrolase [Candidatus Marinimicrobia bacterium]|nr:serine hydrolase [Candidatus Neomarinimicrobiota bacterium]
MRMKVSIIYLLTTAFFIGCAAKPEVEPQPVTATQIEQTIAGMTLEEKVGQIFMLNFNASYYNNENPVFDRISRWVTDYKVGGLAMFGGDPMEGARNIYRFQKMAEMPLLIASDLEWGLPMRLSAGTRFPENMALAATRNANFAYEQGIITAKEAKSLGIHVTFAPVLDVNSNPDNPIINVRSYSENPYLVSEFGTEYIRGVQSQNIIATAKHFPGHGDTETDSHLMLPSIEVSRERLNEVELLPFKAAIDAGVKMVMVAHIAMPELPEGEKPATFSKFMIQDVLRDSLGFEGAVITDAMNMGGVTENWWPGEAAIQAVLAGADIVLMPPEFEIAYRSVLNAAKSGRIPMKRVNDAVRHIFELKNFARVNDIRYPDPDSIETTMEDPAHLETAEQAFQESVTLVKDDSSYLPLKPEKIESMVSLIFTEHLRYGYPGGTFTSEIRSRVDRNQVFYIHPNISENALNRAREAAEAADAVAVGVFVRFASYKGSLNIPKEQADFLNEIFEISKPIVTVGFGTPYLLRNFPEAPTYLIPYSASHPSQSAVVQAIFGEKKIDGKLPITLPAGYNYGHGMGKSTYSNVWKKNYQPQRFDSLFTLIEEGIQDSVAPGMAVYIARDGEVLLSEGFGNFTYDPTSPRVDSKTIFDMASITKVMATTPLAMKLYEQNVLNLHEPVWHYIPGFRGGMKDSVDIYNLLTHSSGFPPYIRFWNVTGARGDYMSVFFNKIKFWESTDYVSEVMGMIINEELVYTPGDSTLYSDLGIILMGSILEKIRNTPLETLVEDEIYEPLGMHDTRYIPEKKFWDEIVPTEYDIYYRKRQIQGEVHDENSALLGGVAGHAGLFSTAEDMGRYAQMLLSNGYYDGVKFLKQSTIDRFTAEQNITESSTRAIGWDTVSDSLSLFGDYFSDEAFCHTGYTGTSMIIDPEYNTIVILLTNRVYPTRRNYKIGDFRPKFHNLVMETLLTPEQLAKGAEKRAIREKHEAMEEES